MENMENEELNNYFVKKKMDEFSNIDFTDASVVFNKILKITDLMGHPQLNFSTEEIASLLMEHGYNTFIDMDLNDDYKNVGLVTYIFQNPDLDEVARYLISIWIQQLLDFDEISIEMQYYLFLYNARLEIEKESRMIAKQKVKEIK